MYCGEPRTCCVPTTCDNGPLSYSFMGTHTHTYKHTYKHISTHTRIHTHTHVHTHVHTHPHVHTHTYTHTYAHPHLRTYTHMYTHLCTHTRARIQSVNPLGELYRTCVQHVTRHVTNISDRMFQPEQHGLCVRLELTPYRWLCHHLFLLRKLVFSVSQQLLHLFPCLHIETELSSFIISKGQEQLPWCCIHLTKGHWGSPEFILSTAGKHL